MQGESLSDSHSIGAGNRCNSPERCSTLSIIRSRMSPLSCGDECAIVKLHPDGHEEILKSDLARRGETLSAN